MQRPAPCWAARPTRWPAAESWFPLPNATTERSEAIENSDLPGCRGSQLAVKHTLAWLRSVTATGSLLARQSGSLKNPHLFSDDARIDHFLIRQVQTSPFSVGAQPQRLQWPYAA